MLAAFSLMGSPPPMRGKVYADAFGFLAEGITPAYAGKRPVWIAASRHGWDHPRLCGEKSSLSFVKMILSGSPPPMRGKVCIPKVVVSYSGITPAYAGKSGNFHLMRAKPQDHPRLCGEKHDNLYCYNFVLGSPPPMRGKVIASGEATHNLGITPAYAGKSC